MTVVDEIAQLASHYASELGKRISDRVEEMEEDDQSHFLVYRVLGIGRKEGRLIDQYQNKGRFLYRYAGSFLERAAKVCFSARFPGSGSTRISNTPGQRPKTFEIDCLVGSDAIEIKWRDATTDGDHITKEHAKIRAVVNAGYTPIRVMFYYPNRDQAVRIQQTLQTLYQGVGGKYYYGDTAWQYMREKTGINLLQILENLAKENGSRLTITRSTLMIASMS